jgi:hypothetical protein
MLEPSIRDFVETDPVILTRLARATDSHGVGAEYGDGDLRTAQALGDHMSPVRAAVDLLDVPPDVEAEFQ